MKLKKEKSTRLYEFTYLLPATYTSDKISDVNTSVLGQVKKLGFDVVSQDEWGKKELAYSIRFDGENQTEAHYYHLMISADTSKVKEFENYLKLNQELMRYLFVVSEDQEVSSTEVREEKK